MNKNKNIQEFWKTWYKSGGSREQGRIYLAQYRNDFGEALGALEGVNQAPPAPISEQGRLVAPDRSLAAQAKRNRAERIDVLTSNEGLIVSQFADNFGKWVNVSYTIKVGGDLDATLDELEAAGWTVRRWRGGGRAFEGEPRPIRSRRQILKLRNDINTGRRNDLLDMGLNLNLAYDG